MAAALAAGSAGRISGGSSSSANRPRVNLRSTAVKRIMQEAAELADADDADDFVAAPLESDIFEWHCTMRGVRDSEFEGGLYHLRILLPPSYPMSAPDIILMTPNGRFELGKKICIDGLTSFHAGSWQPAWGVRTAILGLRSFWMQGGEALSAIGALDYNKDERRRLAKVSRDWICPVCAQANVELLPDTHGHERASPSTRTQSPAAETSPPVNDAVEPHDTLELAPPAPLESIAAPASIAVPISDADEISEGLSLLDTRLSAPQPAVPAPTDRPTGPAAEEATRTTAPILRPRSRPPPWIDALIFFLTSLLVLMIARRMSI